MTKRALGPGAACCGEPEDCDLGCFTAPQAPAPAPVTEDDDHEAGLFDEEGDE